MRGGMLTDFSPLIREPDARCKSNHRNIRSRRPPPRPCTRPCRRPFFLSMRQSWSRNSASAFDGRAPLTQPWNWVRWWYLQNWVPGILRWHCTRTSFNAWQRQRPTSAGWNSKHSSICCSSNTFLLKCLVQREAKGWSTFLSECLVRAFLSASTQIKYSSYKSSNPERRGCSCVALPGLLLLHYVIHLTSRNHNKPKLGCERNS